MGRERIRYGREEEGERGRREGRKTTRERSVEGGTEVERSQGTKESGDGKKTDIRVVLLMKERSKVVLARVLASP